MQAVWLSLIHIYPQTWVTTGHVSSFSDPLLDCRACKARHRADKLIGEEHPEVNEEDVYKRQSHGLSDEVKKAAALKFSVGRITMPHQLARLVLTEQIYRACTINAEMCIRDSHVRDGSAQGRTH